VSKGPCGGFTFDLVVWGDWLKAGLLWVFAHALFHKVLWFNTLWCFLVDQGDAVTIQDGFGVMDPVIGAAHSLDGRDGGWALLGDVLLDLGGWLLLHSEHTLGHEGSAESNAGDLSTEQELFMLVQEGVGNDSALEVTWEVELNLSRDGNVLRSEVGEHGPLVFTWAVTNPVGEFVGAGVSWLNVNRCALSCLRGFSTSLSNVVAAFSTVDLTPEAQFGGTGRLGKVLHRLLEKHALLLTEVNVSPLVDWLVFLNQVGHEANWSSISGAAFFLIAWFCWGISFLGSLENTRNSDLYKLTEIIAQVRSKNCLVALQVESEWAAYLFDS
jgi:hypothetical protein